MFEAYWDITADLDLLSPLHLGTGQRTQAKGVRDSNDPRAQGRDDVSVAQVQRDHQDKPCIPGATIKGMLRRLIASEAVADVCGTARGGRPDPAGASDPADGAMEVGRLTAYASLLKAVPKVVGQKTSMPHLSKETGVYIHARVRIEADSGVAADGKLYHAEAVVPGAVFGLRLRLAGGREADLEALLGALARLSDPAGVPCGRGQSQGQGRLRLRPETLSVVHHALRDTGAMIATPITDAASRLAALAVPPTVFCDLRLTCGGPYVTIDSSRHSLRGKGRTLEEAEQPDQIEPFRGPDGGPMVTGSSVLGVLRHRAGWLAARAALRRGDPPQGQDDPDKICEGPRAAAHLTPVERLFGVTGWRGRLRVHRLEVEDGGQEQPITSVSIDPFSGGAILGALYTTRTFVGVRLRLQLALDDREGLTQADRDLASELIDDLRVNGLMLGHGTNKGFGWFAATESRTTAEAAE